MLDTDVWTTNNFLNKREKSIRSMFYYGEFLAFIDYDDGWKNIIYPQLLKFIEEFSHDKISIDKEFHNSCIHVILACPSPDINQKDIYEVSSDLQKRFFCSPILQHLWQQQDYSHPLPVTMQKVPEESPVYFRWKIQELFTQRQKLEHSRARIDHLVATIGDKTFESALTMQSNISRQIEEFDRVIPEAIAEFYAHEALRETWAAPQEFITLHDPRQNPPEIPEDSQVVNLLREMVDELKKLSRQQQGSVKNEREIREETANFWSDSLPAPSIHISDSKAPLEELQAEEPSLESPPLEEKKAETATQKLLASMELQESEKQSLWELYDQIAQIKQILETQSHQNNKTLLNLLQAEDFSFFVEVWGHLHPWKLRVKEIIENEHKSVKVSIEIPSLHEILNTSEINNTFMTHTQTIEFSSHTTNILLTPKIEDLYKCIYLYVEYLWAFIWENLPVPDIADLDLKVRFQKHIKETLEAISAKDDIESYLKKQQELLQLLDRFHNKLHINFKDQYIDNIVLTTLRHLNIGHCTIDTLLDILESLQTLKSEGKISVIQMSRESWIDLPDEAISIEAFINAHWEDVTIKPRRNDVKIFSGRYYSTNFIVKNTSWKKVILHANMDQTTASKVADKIVRDIYQTHRWHITREFSLEPIFEPIFSKLWSEYMIQDISKTHTNDIYEFKSIHSGESYIVHPRGSIHWNYEEKQFIPKIWLDIIPWWSIWGDIENKIAFLRKKILRYFTNKQV